MQNTQYVKLANLEEFLLEDIAGYSWFQWDTTTNTPKNSQEYFEGAQKTWKLVTDKGGMTVSNSQFSQILVAAFQDKTSEPIGRRFTVKTNGKEGKDRRYFINLAKTQLEKNVEQVFDDNQLPF